MNADQHGKVVLASMLVLARNLPQYPPDKPQTRSAPYPTARPPEVATKAQPRATTRRFARRRTPRRRSCSRTRPSPSRTRRPPPQARRQPRTPRTDQTQGHRPARAWPESSGATPRERFAHDTPQSRPTRPQAQPHEHKVNEGAPHRNPRLRAARFGSVSGEGKREPRRPTSLPPLLGLGVSLQETLNPQPAYKSVAQREMQEAAPQSA